MEVRGNSVFMCLDGFYRQLFIMVNFNENASVCVEYAVLLCARSCHTCVVER